jgi:hypothetical protein
LEREPGNTTQLSPSARSRNPPLASTHLSFRYDPTCLSFLFAAFDLLDNINTHTSDDLSTLGIHVYASVLHQTFVSVSAAANSPNASVAAAAKAVSTAHIDHLLRAITPRIVEYLFGSLERDDATTEQSRAATDPANKGTRHLFYDKKLTVCRCLPLVVNILHASLPRYICVVLCSLNTLV